MINTFFILAFILLLSVGNVAAQEDDFSVEKGHGNVRNIIHVSRYLHTIAASPDRNTLAVGTSGKLYLINFRSGELEKSIDINQEILRVAFTPDGQRISIGGGNGISLVEVDTGEKIWSTPGIPNPKLKTADPASARYMSKYIKITSIKCFPVVKQFANISEDESNLRFWSIQDGTATKIINTNIKEPGALVISPTGMHLALRGADGFGARGSQGTIVSYRLPRMKEMWRNTDGAYGFESVLAFSPDGKLLATGTTSWGEIEVQILNAKSGVVVNEFNLGEGNSLNGIAWTSDGERMITAAENQVALWKIGGADEQPIVLDAGFAAQNDTDNAVVIGLNDTVVAVLGDRKMVKIYDLLSP